MGHRLAPQAQADIDDIAYYVFVESGSLETADRLIESIATRFILLGTHPRAGRRRDDLRPGMRGFPVGRGVERTREGRLRVGYSVIWNSTFRASLTRLDASSISSDTRSPFAS